REEALDAARRSLEVEPHDPADLGRVSHVFISLRAYADAARTMDLRATALAAAGENEEAVRVLFEIADLCKGQLQRPENAAPAMVKILELDPANRRAFDTARELFRKQNDWTTWAQVTDRFLPHISAEDEKLATLRELVSVQENKLGQKDVAFLTACRALHLDAANDGVREEVERLADETGSYEEMAAVYEELADNLPQGAIAERLYLTLAKVHDERLDDPAAAETALRKILEFDPTSPVALESLSAMFARRGRDKEYLTSLEQQLEAAGTIEQRKAILAQIAHVYDTKFQDATEAATALQRSLELEADGPTFTALLALYRREKAWPEVAQTLTRWRDLASTPEERAKLQAEVAGVYEKEIGDDEAAVEAYREALELDPHNHEAVESLEQLYTKLDRPADLLAVYDRQREASQDPRQRVSVLVKSAAIWEEKFNNPANAAEYVELILAEDPYNLQAIKTLERLRRTEERWDALVGVLEKHVLVSTSDEERAALCVEMGDVFHQSLRQVDKAVATYHRALELDRRNLGAMHALGQIYERSGNWPFALEMLAKEAELAGATPHAVELYHRMGKIQDEMLMDVSSARAAFEAALRIDSGYLPSLRSLKQVHERAGDWDSYEHVLAQEAKATDDSEAKARALVELGKHQLERKEDRDGATRTFEEALKHVPDLLEAALPLADVYVAREDWTRAERMLDIVVVKMAQKATDEQDEVMARALCGQLYRLGYVAEKRDRKDKALGSYEKAYQLDPTYLPALEGLGHLLVENQRYDEALKAYQTILVHHREELTDLEVVEIYWQIGEIHYGMQQFDRAQANFEKALSIDPGHEPSLKALIQIADAAERWDHAAEYRESLVGVLEGEPKYQVAIELAMLAREKLSDPYRAIDAYQVAHRIRPESLEVMDALYVLLRETRQAQKAVEVLEKMLAEPGLKKTPKLKQVWFALGEIARDELKDFDRALEAFNAALDADPRFVEAFSALEALLAGQRQWKLLEENYARMIQRIPNTPDTRGVRMMLWRALGDLYRQVLKDDDGALMAYQVVSTGLPDDGPAQEAYAELASKKPGQEAKAIEAWRRALPSSTEPGKVVSAISALHAKKKEYDQAWLAAQAAHGFIGEVGEAEREILTKLGPYAKKREQATQWLTDRHWREHLLHPHVRGHLAQMMGLLFEQVGHAFAAPHSQFQINPKRHRIDVNTAQVLQVHQYRYVSRLLGMEAVELYSPYLVATMERLQKRSSDPAPEPLVGIEICHTHPVCLKVGGKFFPREHSDAAQKELLYALGRTFALLRPELALSQRLSPDRLEALLQAAVSLSVPAFRPTVDRRALDEMRRALDRGLTPQGKAALAREVAAWMPNSSKETLATYLEGAELTAVRSGLFVAGEAEAVKRMVMGENGTA
ncbi:MAG TPA: tetratricopeptide repeat protein, partial [Myxococcaceae bacterium]|nr:tetratricopeptide repeat protein [Myxococcaceae bacterium]